MDGLARTRSACVFTKEREKRRTMHFQVRFLYPFSFTPRSILVFILDVTFCRVQVECELLIRKREKGKVERAGKVLEISESG